MNGNVKLKGLQLTTCTPCALKCIFVLTVLSYLPKLALLKAQYIMVRIKGSANKPESKEHIDKTYTSRFRVYLSRANLSALNVLENVEIPHH